MFRTFLFIEFGKNLVLIRLEHCIEICYYHLCAFPTWRIQVFRRESSDRTYQTTQKKSVVVQDDSSSEAESESESDGSIVCTKRIKMLELITEYHQKPVVLEHHQLQKPYQSLAMLT